MSRSTIFPTEPFLAVADTEADQQGNQGPDFEDELRRTRFPRPPRPKAISRPAKPRPQPVRAPRSQSTGGFRPLPRIGQRTVIEASPWPVEPDTAEPRRSEGSEYVRWIQDCLNNLLATRLPVDGVMSPATRSALRRFQRQRGLRASGILDPDSEAALRTACKTAPEGTADVEDEFGEAALEQNLSTIHVSSRSRRDPVAAPAPRSRIIDLTAMADRRQRRGQRDPTRVRALVLHQMACCFTPKDPLRRFLNIAAHFAILADGRILQLHPVSALIWASNGFNRSSIAVEFAGNFPNTRGQWWQGERFGRNRLTAAQIEAGRYLIRHLVRTLGLKFVLSHRQSSASRENDPGPDIWYHVGQWAVETFGVSDGGPGFKIGTGRPIPEVWKNWGRKGGGWEIGLHQELSGSYVGGMTFDRAIDNANSSAGIYVLYENGSKPIYVGHSTNLTRRLQEHKLCLTRLDIDPSNYLVKLELMPKAKRTKLKEKERYYINKWKRRVDGGSLLNVHTKELELDAKMGRVGALGWDVSATSETSY